MLTLGVYTKYVYLAEYLLIKFISLDIHKRRPLLCDKLKNYRQQLESLFIIASNLRAKTRKLRAEKARSKQRIAAAIEVASTKDLEKVNPITLTFIKSQIRQQKKKEEDEDFRKMIRSLPFY